MYWKIVFLLLLYLSSSFLLLRLALRERAEMAEIKSLKSIWWTILAVLLWPLVTAVLVLVALYWIAVGHLFEDAPKHPEK